MIINNKAKWSSFNIILAIVGVIIALANVYGRIRKFELEVLPLHIDPYYGSSMALMALRPYIKFYLPGSFLFILIIVTCFVIVLVNKDLREYIYSYTIFSDSSVNPFQSTPSNQENIVNSSDHVISIGQLTSNNNELTWPIELNYSSELKWLIVSIDQVI